MQIRPVAPEIGAEVEGATLENLSNTIELIYGCANGNFFKAVFLVLRTHVANKFFQIHRSKLSTDLLGIGIPDDFLCSGQE